LVSKGVVVEGWWGQVVVGFVCELQRMRMGAGGEFGHGIRAKGQYRRERERKKERRSV
jgi:hypothetical protein